MAFKMLLKEAKLPFIWNVSYKVGCAADCTNAMGDVELVNFFMNFIKNDIPEANTRKVYDANFEIYGKFTAASGFWLFYLQRERQVNFSAGCKIDGKISSASRFDPYTFTIAYFNDYLHTKDRQLFETLDENLILHEYVRKELKQTKRQ